MKVYVLEKEPTPKIGLPTHSYDQRPEVQSVQLGIRYGREFRYDTDNLSIPTSDCWFALTIDFSCNHHTKHGYVLRTTDTIITNGEEYWRVKQNIRDTRLEITDDVVACVDKAVSAFVEPL